MLCFSGLVHSCVFNVGLLSFIIDSRYSLQCPRSSPYAGDHVQFLRCGVGVFDIRMFLLFFYEYITVPLFAGLYDAICTVSLIRVV